MTRPNDQPQTPSPGMNNNFNHPMFHLNPEPPVYEPIVTAEQRYPNNGGRANQPNQSPMGRHGPPQYINNPHNYAAPMARRPVNVINAVPMARPAVQSNWTSGLCDCMNDPENTLITFCFPCVTFGQIAEIIDEGATSCGMGGMMYSLICWCFCVPFIYSCTYRAKLRNKYGLPDAPAPDWITHFCCEYCALCQEYRELKNRGLDPAIGWIGNMQKQRMVQQQGMMAPPQGQRMMG